MMCMYCRFEQNTYKKKNLFLRTTFEARQKKLQGMTVQLQRNEFNNVI